MGVTVMNIGWFRDLVIIIFGLAATVGIVMMIVLAFLCYTRFRPIIDSLKKTTRTMENISSSVEKEVVKPLAQIAAVVQGVRQAFNMFNLFRKKPEGD
jgi:hypothetical protein